MSYPTSVEQFRRRLFKGVNRISWSTSDIHRIAKRFGLASRDIETAYFQTRRETFDGAKAAVVADNSYDYSCTISTPRIDRSDDMIGLHAWDLNQFRRNPLVYFSHLSADLPVGRAPSVWITGSAVKAVIKLAPAAANPLSEQVRQSIDGRFLSAISVGFLPRKWSWAKEANRPYGINFEEVELVEFSVCGVPSNPDCRIDLVPVAIDAGRTNPKNEAHFRRLRELATLKRGPPR